MSLSTSWRAGCHVALLSLAVAALSACDGRPESEPTDPAPTPPAGQAAPASDATATPAAGDPAAATMSSEPAPLSNNGQPAASETPDEAGQPQPRSDQDTPPER